MKCTKCKKDTEYYLDDENKLCSECAWKTLENSGLDKPLDIKDWNK